MNTRLRVSAAVAPAVKQFVADFRAVTDAWVRDGWHTCEEVNVWREAIRALMGASDVTDADVLEVCRFWRGIAEKVKRGEA